VPSFLGAAHGRAETLVDPAEKAKEAPDSHLLQYAQAAAKKIAPTNTLAAPPR
jgi:hypothetical protein